MAGNSIGQNLRRGVALMTGAWLVAASATPAEGQRTAGGDRVTAFVGVHVVPMDTETVLANHTVIVEGDHIVALGPTSDIEVPAGALRIEGAGRFLMPGLADLHVHLRYQEDLPLYVANGVTTILDMGAAWFPARAAARVDPREVLREA